MAIMKYDDYSSLVFRLARKYSERYLCPLSYDDLCQEGSIGLLTAIENYNPEMGAGEFFVFATIKITGAIKNAIKHELRWKTHHQTNLVKESISFAHPLASLDCTSEEVDDSITEHLARLKPKTQEFIRKWCGLNGLPPMTRTEIAKESNISEPRVSYLIREGLKRLREIME